MKYLGMSMDVLPRSAEFQHLRRAYLRGPFSTLEFTSTPS